MKLRHFPSPSLPALCLFAACLVLLLSTNRSAAQLSDPFVYLSPRPGAAFVPPGTTIIARTLEKSAASLLTADSFYVRGSLSGVHGGKLLLAGDGRTAIFTPHAPFIPGESVAVRIKLEAPGAAGFASAYAFTIGDAAQGVSEGGLSGEPIQQPARAAQTPAQTRYLTAPSDLSTFTVERRPGQLGDGYLFLSTLDPTFNPDNPGYLYILDNDGEPVYYHRPQAAFASADFKKQGNGLLTYFLPLAGANKFYGMNDQYEVVTTYAAGNGYPTDLHDLQILNNGNYLLLVHDTRIIDMSGLIPHGDPQTEVIGCIVQEIDSANNVVFQWRSWDHFDILDTFAPLLANPLRYVHCNSIAQTLDGNLLLSSRNLSEVTKINRESGEIMWRLGGRQNQFEFVNDYGFSYQHDARSLANGNVSVYDNGNLHTPEHSRGVEYALNEVNKRAFKVADFRSTPDVYANAMGNMQTLDNGNRVVGWGRSSRPVMSEFDSSGVELLRLSTAEPMTAYRSFRFPWQGYPTWPPVLIAYGEENTAHLHFSWNGSTETVSYKILGGRSSSELRQFTAVFRSGFETTHTVELPQQGLWYFKVIPVDSRSIDGIPSNLAVVALGGDTSFLPFTAGR